MIKWNLNKYIKEKIIIFLTRKTGDNEGKTSPALALSTAKSLVLSVAKCRPVLAL